MNEDTPNEEKVEPREPVRPTEHRERKWVEYMFQFLMVFLAVMASFYAENLREENGERQRARDYASSLIKDLIRDTGNIQYHIQRMEQAIAATDRLANYVRGKDIKQLNNIDLFRLSQIVPNPPFRWSRATMQQIKSSGSLRYFTNDSIIYYISSYDAITLHLDQDNMQDQERYQRAEEAKSHVVDLNYPKLFKDLIRSNPDSLMGSVYYSQLSKSLQSLLTKDINEVKWLVNEYLQGSNFLVARTKELSTLIADEKRLIALLKLEYDLP